MKSLGNQQHNLRSFLARAVAGTFGLQVASAGLGYLSTLFLARLLGAAGYGSYAYAIALLNLLLIPAVLGLRSTLTRDIAVYRTQADWGAVRGLLQWANNIVLWASIFLAVVTLGVVWQLSQSTDSQTLIVLAIALLSLPVRALTELRQAAMYALQHIVSGQLPEMLIRPLLFVTLLGSGYLTFGDKFTAPWAMAAYAFTSVIAFFVGNHLLKKAVSRHCQPAPAQYQRKLWLQRSLPMLLVGGMYVINNQTDKVMLGAMQGVSAVGIYNIASQGTKLITFVLIAFGTSLGPTFASLYAQGNISRLQQIITKSCRLILLSALPISIGLIVFGAQFLSLFGPDFVQGKTVLAILSIGQLTNAATGTVALLLTMTNHQKDVATGVTLSALLNIILNALLIPRWGAEGAAVATASSAILWNVLLVIVAYKRIGIHSTALGKLF